MKQQFEVGDKAIWKGGCVLKEGGSAVKGVSYPEGTEIVYRGYSLVKSFPLLFEFPDGSNWGVTHDQIKSTTPTTIVTVHGNPDWKPEKGELEYKLLKDLPGLKAGYLMSLGDVYFTAINPAKYPDFFAPVYKAKPIEFTKCISHDRFIGTCVSPNTYGQIVLIKANYDNSGLDLMYAYEGMQGDCFIYLGHFNSGTI